MTDGTLKYYAHLLSSLAWTPTWDGEVPIWWRAAFADLAMIAYDSWEPPLEVAEYLGRTMGQYGD